MGALTTKQIFQAVATAAANRQTGDIAPWTTAYLTDGGTYIIASAGHSTDSGRPRDLVAVLPGNLEGSRVLQLNITVNPDLLDVLRAKLDQ